jgi:uncharacterized cofD-like protein
MTQPGETDGFTTADHIRVLVDHSHPRALDYCIVNIGTVPQGILSRYEKENAYLVVNDRKKIESMGYRVIEEDLVAVEDEVVRHNAIQLAKIILGLAEEI